VESVARPGSPIVVLRRFGSYGAYEAYDAASGRRRFTLPYGLASADGAVYLSTKNRRETTLLRRYDARTGRLRRTLPLGPKRYLSQISANGSRAVVGDARTLRGRIRYEVVDTTSGEVIRRLTLPRTFETDGISNDGRRLFVIEHRRGSYRVRVLDVPLARVRPGSVRVKNENEPMRGYAASSIGSPDGRWLLTLYVRPRARESFVHALDLRRAVAYCLDLPGAASAAALRQYALTLSRDGRTLLAANRALGRVAAVDLRSLHVRLLARFSAVRGPSPNWSNAAVSRDGKTLWFGDVHGLWLLHGAVRGPFRIGPVAGFAFTPGGRRLTVIRLGLRPLHLDAETGRPL
jgi:dipeptidyl aminopeptidase/acylaminoacyl peptidase